ncbi:type II toxin-antitoxin system RelE/ParE family toxin [Tundrisphaera lichenicola]|uniref:type II toxin-antitoxin system RelE/ParE family toxin n=1 Tax=Tundrisphaera lichenicola TaxID=2029860 RepID=UPI003EBE278B
MTYRVELARTATADIREQARYLRDEVSPSAAEKWLSGLDKALATLATRPFLCPLAAESDKFPRPIRELYHGRRKSNRFRVLFEITEEGTINVLYVRHTARDEIEP